MLRVGILGTGGMGSVHAVQYSKMSDVELYCYDRHDEKVETFCKRFDSSKLESREELLKRCDVIDICLPTDLHLDAGLAAIAMGKAVLMEKPMCRTVSECAQLIEVAEKAGVPLMPAQVVRFFPEFEKAHQLIQQGEIGRPAAARTRRGGKKPLGSDGWFMDYVRSGGVLLDLAIHDFDWLRWTLGEVKVVFSRSVASSTYASHGAETNEPGVQGDYALTTLTFESGAVGHVEATWLDPSGFRTTFEVCGSEGMIEFDSRQGATLKLSTEQTILQEAPLAPTDDPYYREIRGFLDAVRDHQTAPVGAHDGLLAVGLAEAAIQSTRTGRPVRPAGCQVF